MKKSKILTSIPQNLVIYHIKILCHHIKHTLYSICGQNMEQFEQILLVLLSFF
jgi:hypothetical protein